MKCNDVLDRIEELVDELLPPEEAVWRSAHIEGCAECAAHLEEARRFRALIAAEGSDALLDWHAHELAARAVALSLASREETTPVAETAAGFAPPVRKPARPPTPRAVATPAVHRRPTPFWRRAGARYAAAAAVLAAGLVVGVGALGTKGPQVLAAGTPVTLSAGEAALTGPGRHVRAERTLRLYVEPDKGGTRVRMDGGAALFRLDPERHCHISTPGGKARSEGSTFLLEVRQNGSVAVTVLAGRVQFDGRSRLQLDAGDRLEVDRNRASHIVNRARLEELELGAQMSALETGTLHEEVDRLSEEIATLRAAADGAAERAGGVTDPSDLPWEELGAALRDMLGRSRSDAVRQRALGTLLVHAEAIRQLTGQNRPTEAIAHPAFLRGVATGFMQALEPDAHADCRAAAAAAMGDAADRLEFVLDGDPVATEARAAHQRFAHDVLVAVRDNLGQPPADQLAADLPEGWDPLRASPMNAAEARSRMSAWWAKRFEFDDVQKSALDPIVDRYVTETIAVQAAIEERLGAEAASRILYPERRRWSGRRSSGASKGSEERQKWTPPNTDERLRRLEALLEIARPRIEFERALVGLLSEKQRERGLGRSYGVPTFRPAEQ